jgi:hypothetical protein
MVMPESLDAAAARLEEIAPGYLERIRKRAAGMGVPRTPTERARRSIDLVVEAARINPNAPLVSRRRSGRFLKRVVGSLARFYVVFVADQVTDLGESASWMGSALCDYVDGLEAEVVALRERVTRLEAGQGRP